MPEINVTDFMQFTNLQKCSSYQYQKKRQGSVSKVLSEENEA